MSESKGRAIYVTMAAISAALMVGMSIGVMITADGPSGFSTVIGPGCLVKEYEAIVFYDSGTYYLQNGTTGDIDYSSDNSTTILRYATDHYQSIFLRKGTYTVYVDPIYLTKDYAIIAGEGYSTVLTAHSSLAGSGPSDPEPILQSNSSYTVIKEMTFDGGDIETIYGWHGAPLSHSHLVTHCLFRNMDTTGGAADASSAPLSTFTDNHFVNTYTGIGLSGTDYNYGHVVSGNVIENCTWGIYTEYSYNTTITNNVIRASVYGIRLYGSYHSIGNVIVSGNSISMTDGTNGMAAIQLDVGHASYGYARNCSIDGNTLRSVSGNIRGIALKAPTAFIAVSNNMICDFEYGLDVYGSWHQIRGNTIVNGTYGITFRSGPDRCFISNNYLYSQSTKGFTMDTGGGDYNTIINNEFLYQLVGVYIPAAALQTKIAFNYFHSCTTPIDNSSSTSVVNYNIGYVTENSGVASTTGSVNTVTVNHGLVTTPYIVVITGANSGIGFMVVSSKTTTQFVITFENQPGASTWVFYWYAQTW